LFFNPKSKIVSGLWFPVPTKNDKNKSDIQALSPKDMSSAVFAAYGEDGLLNVEELEKFSRGLYELNKNSLSHGIVDRKERDKGEEEAESKEDKLIAYFETTSPRQFLIDISDGAEPSINDLIIVEDILFNQKLSPSVVNVLLYYVMLKSDYQLNRKYIEKIASHWARKNIKRAKEAMDFCIKANRQSTNRKNQKKNQYQKNDQKVPRGKLLNLFLLDSSHHQLTRLTLLLGFQRDEETIAHLLNEAYQKYNG
jgi:replication initiation and membrane attachment protein